MTAFHIVAERHGFVLRALDSVRPIRPAPILTIDDTLGACMTSEGTYSTKPMGVDCGTWRARRWT